MGAAKAMEAEAVRVTEAAAKATATEGGKATAREAVRVMEAGTVKATERANRNPALPQIIITEKAGQAPAFFYFKR